jgi:type II secretory pathway component PulF
LCRRFEYFERLQFFLKRQYPLAQALELLLEQTLSPHFATLTAQWLMNLKSGKTDFPENYKIDGVLKVFIQNGLQAQALEPFLAEALGLLKMRQELASKFLQSGLYPAIVLGCGVLLWGFLSIWILPQLVSFFEEAHVALPTALAFYMQCQKVLPWLLAAGLIIAALARIFFRTTLKILWARFLSQVLKGLQRWEVWVDFQVLPWLMGFKALIHLGWSEVPAMQASLSLSPHFAKSLDVSLLIRDLQSGKALSQAFQSQKRVPVFVRQQLLLVAEAHDLEEILKNMEAYYQRKIEKFLKVASTLMEPLLMGVMGLLVGALIIFIFFPLLQSMQTISF